MSVVQTVPVPNNYVSMRYQEIETSSAINRSFFGTRPKGIYSGFVLQVIGPRAVQLFNGTLSGGIGSGLVGPGYLSGAYDESIGTSIAVVNGNDGHQTVVQLPPGKTYNFNLAGQEGKRVFIAIEVQYQSNAVTFAYLRALEAADLNTKPQAIVVGYVDVPVSPMVALSPANIGYNDPQYPRLNPIANQLAGGYMSPSQVQKLDTLIPQNDLMLATVSNTNAFTVEVTPSQKIYAGKRLYSYIQGGISSRFPRNISGNYAGDNLLTTLNFQIGIIAGAHAIPGNNTFAVPSVSGVPNSFQLAVMSINPRDEVVVNYGSVYGSSAAALLDANFPVVSTSNLQIFSALVETDSLGNVKPFGGSSIQDRRPFMGSAGFGLGSFPLFVQESLSGVVDGVNDTFTISSDPYNYQSLIVAIDGIVQRNPEDYSIAGTTVTFVNPPVIGQTVWAHYVKPPSNPIALFFSIQEEPSTVVDGVETQFALSGSPINQASTLVFLDGSLQPTNSWNLIQGAVSKVEFLTAPAIGQTVRVLYFQNNIPGALGSSGNVNNATNIGALGIGLYSSLVNGVLQFKKILAGPNTSIVDNLNGTITISSSGGGGGGGSGGSLSGIGSDTLPLTINPLVGIPFGAGSDRQVVFVKGQTGNGAQNITAAPQIEAGTKVGQELVIIGTDNADYPVLQDGSGVLLNGNCNLTNNMSIYLVWGGSIWREVSRR